MPKMLAPAAFRRLCVETRCLYYPGGIRQPAAFRRLCVETLIWLKKQSALPTQPPSGGCVLKQHQNALIGNGIIPAAFRRLCVETGAHAIGFDGQPAAFRRLCVETMTDYYVEQCGEDQPPSGGCVLKPHQRCCQQSSDGPAAFRRLCVETLNTLMRWPGCHPAAFRRLCVETSLIPNCRKTWRPAAFRRLCVETVRYRGLSLMTSPAAFRRLCVETDGAYLPSQ